MRRPVRRRADDGMVTAELAVAFPALVFLTVTLLWGVAVAAEQVSCVDAARAGARAAARGEPLPAVRAAVARAAPAGADIRIDRRTDITTVAVTVTVRPPVRLGLPALTVHEQAEAATEPGAAP